MYRIALCDDERIFLETQEKTCKDIMDKIGIEYCVEAFNSSSDFLNSFLQEQSYYDMILLDIIMSGTNGMELAAEIRKHDNNVTIIFISSTSDYALQGYDVNAFHYLLKPVASDVLERLIISDYYNKFHNRFITFKSGKNNLRISIKDIICFETVGRRVAITLTDRVVYYSGKLTELLARLPKEQFVRCHQAFAVNINNISELARRSAFTINGLEIPISRTFTKDVQKAFLKSICGNDHELDNRRL